MKKINLMIVSLMVLILAIGSVFAGTDGSLLSDDEDFDDEYGDDFELDGSDDDFDEDDSGSDDDWEDDDFDEDDSGSDDDWEDDDSDYNDEDEDFEEDFEEDFDGEFDGEFELTASSFSLSGAKGMNMGDGAYSSAGSQNSVNANPQTGNPIFILLLSLLLLIVIPLRK